jgi:cyclase
MMSSKRGAVSRWTAVLSAAGLASAFLAAGTRIQAQRPGLDVVRLRPNFAVIAGAGGNVGVQFGPDGAVVVDSGTAARAADVVAAIKQVTSQPIRYVINTGPDVDHVGGNDTVAKAGQTILNLNNAQLSGLTNGGAAAVLASEGVLRRMSAPTGQTAPFPTAAWPTETFDGRRSYMYLNGEGIETLHQPAAHTDADSVVFFRKTDVVMAGDVLDATRFPVIDLAKGGSIQGEIDALNKLVELAIPSFPLVWQEGGTYVVPGHGRVYEQFDVVEYRDMLVIIRDRVKGLIAQKQALAQVKAARPTRGYPQFGSTTGPWTTDMFVEAVYRSLSETKRP